MLGKIYAMRLLNIAGFDGKQWFLLQHSVAGREEPGQIRQFPTAKAQTDAFHVGYSLNSVEGGCTLDHFGGYSRAY